MAKKATNVSKETKKSKATAETAETAEAVQTVAQPIGPVVLPDYLKGRPTEIGRVVSNKMQKTVVVVVERRKQHPIYKKVMKRSVRFMAHDEMGAQEGDTVRIIESRPISANKRWRVIEILTRAEKV